MTHANPPRHVRHHDSRPSIASPRLRIPEANRNDAAPATGPSATVTKSPTLLPEPIAKIAAAKSSESDLEPRRRSAWVHGARRTTTSTATVAAARTSAARTPNIAAPASAATAPAEIEP